MDKEQLAIFVCGYTAMLLFVYIASWIREIAEKERQEDEKNKTQDEQQTEPEVNFFTQLLADLREEAKKQKEEWKRQEEEAKKQNEEEKPQDDDSSAIPRKFGIIWPKKDEQQQTESEVNFFTQLLADLREEAKKRREEAKKRREEAKKQKEEEKPQDDDSSGGGCDSE